MKAKHFLKFSVATAIVALTLCLTTTQKAEAQKPAAKSHADIVAVMGGEPDVMVERMFKEFGGIGRFVKQGAKVVLKPNIGWAKTPEMAANTNPELVGAIVRLCLKAGAKEVLVFDHTCDDWQKCYQNSGIADAVKKAGGTMVPGNDESYYREVTLPKGVELKKAKIHKAILDCDVWFNIPVLKHHGGAKLTASMKNYMGIVWDRMYFHKNDLQQCIADVVTFSKKPALHIVDGYRVMKSNGPQGKNANDVAMLRTLIASADPVAADAAALRFFAQVRKDITINEATHVANGAKLNIGTADIDKLNIKRIKLD